MIWIRPSYETKQVRALPIVDRDRGYDRLREYIECVLNDVRGLYVSGAHCRDYGRNFNRVVAKSGHEYTATRHTQRVAGTSNSL